MSGMLSQEWQPASDRVNDFGRCQGARECQTGLVGYRRASFEAAEIATGQKPAHPGRIPYVRHSPAKLR